MTPKNSGIPLAGWGATHKRLAATIISPIECLCTAVGNSEEPELLLFNLDLCVVLPDDYAMWQDAVSESLNGFPKDRIYISCVHSHAAPDVRSSLESIAVYKEYTKGVLADCAKRAICDMKPAKVYYGRTEIGKKGMRLNYVRHYTMKNIQDPTDKTVYFSGNNFGYQYVLNPDKYAYTGNESEADPEMQIVEFRRENADTILFMNWQCHCVMTGGVASTNMGADFAGPAREAVRKLMPNTEVVYVQGACGNINPGTRIREDAIPGLTLDPFRPNDDFDTDPKVYGSILAAYVKECHDAGLTASKTNALSIGSHPLTLTCDHTNDHRVDDAKVVYDRFQQEGNTREVIALANSYGLASPYHATGIIMKSRLPETMPAHVDGVSFGDVAMAVYQFELFDQVGRTIKKESPFAMTLIQGYSNGHMGYLPAEGTTMDGYERTTTRYVPGTAEQLGDEILSLLNEMKK